MFEDQRPILEQLAYNAWLRRGQPIGSADVDWDEACKLFANMQHSQANLASAPGSTPTDLGAELVPETSHDQPRKDR